MNMPTRETGTILAALRLWQFVLSQSGRHLLSGMPKAMARDLGKISTDDGAFTALSIMEIDDVCETINCGPDESQIRSALENAHSALQCAQTQFEQCAKMFREDQDFMTAAALVDEAYEVAGKALNAEPVTVDAAELERIGKYRAGAQKLIGRDEGLAVDDDAKVSLGSDPGAYVAAWIWVSDEEAGIS
jgi:hypothetical protein